MQARLYCEEDIPPHEMDHMREHLEDLKWLKAHVKPRFWRKFVADTNARRPLNAPILEE